MQLGRESRLSRISQPGDLLRRGPGRGEGNSVKQFGLRKKWGNNDDTSLLRWGRLMSAPGSTLVMAPCLSAAGVTRSLSEGEGRLGKPSIYLIILDVEVAKASTVLVALVMVFCAASWTLLGRLLPDGRTIHEVMMETYKPSL